MNSPDPNRELDASVRAMQQSTAGGLGEVRARRVFARVMAEVDGAPRAGVRARHWLFGGLALTLAAGAASLLFVARPVPQIAPTLELVVSSGQVELAPPLPAANASGANAAARVAPSAVTLGEGARVGLQLGARGRVALWARAALSMRQDGALELARGSASFRWGDDPKSRELVVAVGSSRVRGEGASFAVHADEGGLRAVEVFAGRVEVAGFASAPIVLSRGEVWGNLPAAAHDGEATLDGGFWTEHDARARRFGYLEVRSEPTAAVVEVDGVTFGEAPLFARLPEGPRQLRVHAPGRREYRGAVTIDEATVARTVAVLEEASAASDEGVAEPAPTVRRGLRRGGTGADWDEARAALGARDCRRVDATVRDLVARSRSDEDRAQAEMLRAECAVRSAAVSKALGVHEQVLKRYPTSSAAEEALFESTRLLAELGKSKRALARVNTYLSRYPSGLYADPASFRRCELLDVTGRGAEGEACLVDYRRDYPSGLRGEDAAWALAGKQRARGAYAEAAALYGEVLGRKTTKARREEAMYNRASCLRRAASPGAAKSVEDYLREFPEGRFATELREAP